MYIFALGSTNVLAFKTLFSMLTLNLTSTDYSVHMTSWTNLGSNMKGIALKEAFSLVLMFEVVLESSEFLSRSSLRYIV